jgi:hypothetical protein
MNNYPAKDFLLGIRLLRWIFRGRIDNHRLYLTKECDGICPIRKSVRFTAYPLENQRAMKGPDKMQIRETSISYSDYIKGIDSLDIDEQLTLLEIISSKIKNNIRKRRNKRSILNLEGLGAGIWNGIDAQAYIRQERSSWD